MISENELSNQISVSNITAILEVARRLGTSSNLEELLDMIVRETTIVLNCERASLFLYDAEKKELYSKIATGTDQIRVPMDCGIVGACANSGKLINVPDAYSDPRFNPDVDRKLGYHTRNILSAPLIGYDGKLVGVLQAINKRNGKFEKIDEWLIETLGSQAAVALQRAQLLKEYSEKQRLERELDLAREIQEGLLPKTRPNIKGYDIAGWNRPAEQTGGDCFDFITVDDDTMHLLLADASGHGIAPALVVSQIRTMLRALVGVDLTLERTLERINNILCDDLPMDRFITAVIGTLDAQRHTLEYCSAGHGPLLFIRPSQNKVEVRPATTCPMGIVSGMDFQLDVPFIFEPGDTLLIVTDGFFEWFNAKGEQFGVERLKEVALSAVKLPAEQIIEKILYEVEKFADGTMQEDDLTAIVVKRVDN